jgi:hypothetical protein
MRARSAALLATVCLCLAGCAGDVASVDTAPLAVADAARGLIATGPARATSSGAIAQRPAVPPAGAARATSSRAIAQRPAVPPAGAARTTSSRATRHSSQAVVRRPAVPPAGTAAAEPATPTPAGPGRASTAEAQRPQPLAAAPLLAAPACEQYVAALAGRLPAPVRARRGTQGLAIVSDAVAAALLGMPIVVPRASRAAREQLDDAHARLTRALAAAQDADAAALARDMRPLISAYAGALGIAACG